jgi:hypothetical protein
MFATDEIVSGSLTVQQDLLVYQTVEVGNATIGSVEFPAYAFRAYSLLGGAHIDQAAYGTTTTWNWWSNDGVASKQLLRLEDGAKLSLYSSSNSTTPIIVLDAGAAEPGITISGMKVLTEETVGTWIAGSGGTDGKLALGASAQADGGSSSAVGTQAHAIGYVSSAFGYQARSAGLGSSVFGSGSSAIEDYAVALGYNTTVSGESSVAVGREAHTESSFALAIGAWAHANAHYSTAIGFGAYTTQPYQIALGSHNQPSDDALFMIGNGWDWANRSNALIVSKSGDLWTAGKIWAQKTSINEPAIQIRGGLPGGPRLQVFGLDADSTAWMGLGADMGRRNYEHSVYFPKGPEHIVGRLTIGDYDGSIYNVRVTVLRDGNVGIGTNDPSEKLDVAGNATISGDATVKGTLRVRPAGDLSMGTFTAGTQP